MRSSTLVRQFSPEYLDRTRRGLWDDRAALDPLTLSSREHVVDVGCGSGSLSQVIAEEAPQARLTAIDADPALLQVARERGTQSILAGDATRLPLQSDVADLVACQALLVNVAEPANAVAEFVRVSTELVAAIEPDNGDVTVTSTVDTEAPLAAKARELYLTGVNTDVAPGTRIAELFAEAGLVDIHTRRRNHTKRVTPPYSEDHLTDAKRKASGSGLAGHATQFERVLSTEQFDSLQSRWRAMGRDIIEQMTEGAYERSEVVPFDVTVGRLPADR